MPIYEFRCGSCRTTFEILCRDSRAEGVACPECGGTSLSRLISVFAISRNLTPCGTPAAEAAPGCGYNSKMGGCGRCGLER